MPKTTGRRKIHAIIILLEDGTTKVIQGKELADPKGGCLFWNDFGALEVLKGFYESKGEKEKAQKVEKMWKGQQEGAKAGMEPSIMIKPECSPDPWP